MEIRYITPADDRMEISRLYKESWRFAYCGMIPQDYLDSIPEERWAAGIDTPGRNTLLCLDNGRLIGTSSFCESRFEQFPGWGEIISIYLLPDYMGKGYGKDLMETVLSELKSRGYKDAFLWVLEENVRARRFYERFGFLGTKDDLNVNIGGKELREVRYIYKA